MNLDPDTLPPAGNDSPPTPRRLDHSADTADEGRAVSVPPRPWKSGESLLMVTPALVSTVLILLVGPAALLLGLMLTLVAALYGGARAAEHRPDRRTLAWLGAFAGIGLLNLVLAFGGCAVAIGVMRP